MGLFNAMQKFCVFDLIICTLVSSRKQTGNRGYQFFSALHNVDTLITCLHKLTPLPHMM